MKSNEIIDLLIEEIDEKKTFSAKWSTECSGCGDEIDEGDTFLFYGDQQKICIVCNVQITKYLRDLDTQERSKNEKQKSGLLEQGS